MSTISAPNTYLDPRQDATELHHAFKGFGCDEKKVIEILGHRNYIQRHEIRDAYRNAHKEDLIHRLKSELHSNLETALVLWMEDAADRDAIILRDALKGSGTNDKSAIEVICSRTSSQMQVIQAAYNSRFNRSLESDVSNDTSGDYRKLLLAYISQYRPEGPEVDMHLAEKDAESLYKSGKGKIGTDETAIIRILSTRSSAQLIASFNIYRQRYGHDIQKALKSETSGNFSYALRTIVNCVYHPAKYFAKVLYMSMKGIGTDDATLIRVIVTRSEIDMQFIKAEFLREYKKPLENMISSDVSGNYKLFLLTLVGSHK